MGFKKRKMKVISNVYSSLRINSEPHVWVYRPSLFTDISPLPLTGSQHQEAQQKPRDKSKSPNTFTNLLVHAHPLEHNNLRKQAFQSNFHAIKYKKGLFLLTTSGQTTLAPQIFACFQYQGQTKASGLTEGCIELLQG